MSDEKWGWFTTTPNPRTIDNTEDAGQRGWSLHLVDEQLLSEPISNFTGLRGRSLCGIWPNHGWSLDMFIKAPCKRCLARAEKLGIDAPKIP